MRPRLRPLSVRSADLSPQRLPLAPLRLLPLSFLSLAQHSSSEMKKIFGTKRGKNGGAEQAWDAASQAGQFGAFSGACFAFSPPNRFKE